MKEKAATPIPLPSNTNIKSASSVFLPPPFPSHLPRPDNHDFLLDTPPYQESFQTALKTSYEGFVVDSKVDMEESKIQHCLDNMDPFFRRDVTQPFGLGTKCAKTYVTRCLVGDPGTTYKYLGLRMFAHPWKIPATLEEGTKPLATRNSSALTQTIATTQSIFKLSQHLSERTKHHLNQLDQQRKQRGAPATQGRSNFDICLINRMDPTENLKAEPSEILSNLQTSVSWHADSSLEHYSTISVYQTLVDQHGHLKKNQAKKDHWYVAMRVTPHCEGPSVGSFKRKTTIQSTVDQTIPPIAASLPSGSAYYLLDDFNHHHQHTVLLSKEQDAPSCVRYSCTFRLLRDSHNVEYMLRRCRSVITQFHKKGMKVWRSEQLLLTEIECEWIRQFYIQGSQHYELLWDAYWKEPMEALLKYWSQLEQRTQQTCDLLQLAAQGKCFSCAATSSSTLSAPPPLKTERKSREKQKKALAAVEAVLERTNEGADLYESMAELLEERAKLRELWFKREKDHVFTELAQELRPMSVPFHFVDDDPMKSGVTSPLPGRPATLRELATSLRDFGKAFTTGRAQDLPTVQSFSIKTSDAYPNDDAYSQSLTWSGWNQANVSFGLELQDPWASAILDGTKKVETRAYDLPAPLIGKRIWILESPSGTTGVSTLGNEIDFSQPCDCKVVGWCTFTSVVRYTCRTAFEADENRHLVSPQSGYAWKEGATKVIYGWVVGNCGRIKESSFLSASRRMRSLFELKAPAKRKSFRKHADKGQKRGRY